jgi:hypothetical protein
MQTCRWGCHKNQIVEDNGEGVHYLFPLTVFVLPLTLFVSRRSRFGSLDEDSMVQEHNYSLPCANTGVVYGIGLYRIGLDRTLQLGQSLKALLSRRDVLLSGTQ